MTGLASRPSGLKAPVPAPGGGLQGFLRKAARFAVPALAVLVAVIFLARVQAGAENAASRAVGLLPLGFAFGAGIVASLNPCGFLLLPSYISYHLGTQEDGYYARPVSQRLGRAVVLGLVATLGFVVLAALVGGVIATGGQWLIRVFPYAGLGVGAIMAILGIWLLVSGADLGVMAASRVSITPQRNLRNVFAFGVVYAIGSLSCTLPIFLAVIGSSLAVQGPLASFQQFLSYALGMGTILVAVTIASALFRGAVVRWLRSAMPHVHRVSAMFLVGAGAYLVYYWLFFADAIL